MAEQRMVPVEFLERILSITQPIAPAISAEIRAIIDGPGVDPFAYYVYFPDAQDGELCDELDDLIDRMTNERHEVTPLFSGSHFVPARPSAVAFPEEYYWADQRLAAYATDKEK